MKEKRFYELIEAWEMMTIFLTKEKPTQKEFERGLKRLSDYEQELYKILRS